MAEITDREITAIHDTHDKVIRIETVLGNGDSGLCKDVHSHQKRITRLEIIIAGLIGSGLLGIGFIKLLGG